VVENLLVAITKRAKICGQIGGVIPHLVDDGLSILQYVDHTLFFIYDNIEKAKNIKLLLCSFEHLSGLKINFHKSEISYFGDAKKSENIYSKLYGCHIVIYLSG
jgi:hypothetical protein